MTDDNVENVFSCICQSTFLTLIACHIIWSDFDSRLAAVVQVPYRFQYFNSLSFVHHHFISQSLQVFSWFLYLISYVVVLSLVVCFLCCSFSCCDILWSFQQSRLISFSVKLSICLSVKPNVSLVSP